MSRTCFGEAGKLKRGRSRRTKGESYLSLFRSRISALAPPLLGGRRTTALRSVAFIFILFSSNPWQDFIARTLTTEDVPLAPPVARKRNFVFSRVLFVLTAAPPRAWGPLHALVRLSLNILVPLLYPPKGWRLQEPGSEIFLASLLVANSLFYFTRSPQSDRARRMTRLFPGRIRAGLRREDPVLTGRPATARWGVVMGFILALQSYGIGSVNGRSSAVLDAMKEERSLHFLTADGAAYTGLAKLLRARPLSRTGPVQRVAAGHLGGIFVQGHPDYHARRNGPFKLAEVGTLSFLSHRVDSRDTVAAWETMAINADMELTGEKRRRAKGTKTSTWDSNPRRRRLSHRTRRLDDDLSGFRGASIETSPLLSKQDDSMQTTW